MRCSGFSIAQEKRLFERLITVSGVGPKLAIKILSGLSPERTVQAIRSQDHAQLTRIPGVGKKLAERLVVELKDKLDDFAVAPTPSAVRGSGSGRCAVCADESWISAACGGEGDRAVSCEGEGSGWRFRWAIPGGVEGDSVEQLLAISD